LNKHSLMLSVAAAALLAAPAYATATCSTVTTKNPDCVTTGVTTALTTGAPWTSSVITTAVGTPNVGSVYIGNTGTVIISNASLGAITVDSNNYVYSNGVITNKDESSATGILVDMASNRNLSTASFTNAAGTTITGSGIYIDGTTGSSLNLTGSGTAKHGIWLYNSAYVADPTNATIYSYTGNITLISGSVTTIQGDTSQVITIDNNIALNGNLTLGGVMTAEQTTAKSTTASSLIGVASYGQINGNVLLPSGGSLTVSGAGAEGMLLAGTGVNGNLTIGGTLATVGISGSAASTTTGITSSTILPEAGPALIVNAGVSHGIALLSSGSVSTQGAAPAIVIAPLSTATSPLTVGVWTGYTDTLSKLQPETSDPGFSFYNRGAVSGSQLSSSNNPAYGMSIAGASSAVRTILTGGIYNSGSISAAAHTTGSTAAANSAIAVSIGSYATIGENLSAKNVYVSPTNPGDVAAFVNSNVNSGGTISAAVTGTRGGIAQGLAIGANASLPSIINSGSILASVQTSDTTLDGSTSSGGHPAVAIAIQDLSGTLTSIVDTGTIAAQTTTLDNGKQNAIAIDLSSGSLSTPSGSGVTITVQATPTSNASISACNSTSGSTCSSLGTAIVFGTGNKQILNISGDSANRLGLVTGNVGFGLSGVGASGDKLNIGAYGVLTGIVTAPDSVTVNVANHGQLILQNTATALSAVDFNVASGGSVSLGVSESLTNSGLVEASNSATIAGGANLGVAFNSFVPQGTPAFTLVTAPHGKLVVTDLATYNTSVGKSVSACNGTTTDCGGSRPFLFASANLQEVDNYNGTTKDALILNVVPKTAAQLGLTAGSLSVAPLAASGSATPTTLFAQVNAALATDDELGAAMVNGIHNTTDAAAAYNSFAPNITGGTRAIAISITDQATGVVAAHQRALRMYGKDEGGMTLWGDEFVQQIKDPGSGAKDPNTGQKVRPGFKDHGFGFALGVDGGSPKYGWYGGALTFYAGDVNELRETAHSNQQWLLLTGYSTWRGKGLFFDSKIDAGYGHIDGKRFIDLIVGSGSTAALYSREADNKHSGALLSGGFTTGGIFSYGATTLMPQLSVDGLLLREDGYTEINPGTATTGDAFDLRVQPYYAQSLRAFVGFDVRYDINLWDFYLQPEARAGYRYDFFNNPVKLKAAFADIDPKVTGYQPGTQFTMVGPDPAQGNFVVGGSLAATTDTWTLGLNFDLVKGSNGAFEQVATINLLGRI